MNDDILNGVAVGLLVRKRLLLDLITHASIDFCIVIGKLSHALPNTLEVNNVSRGNSEELAVDLLVERRRNVHEYAPSIDDIKGIVLKR